jgi:hypothetical protein
MRVQITVTSDTGIVYTGEAELAASTAASSGRKTRPVERNEPPQVTADIDFGLHVRPFMKKHAQLMTGPKRLTLLIAHIAKGDTKHQVQRADVCRSWNKMTALIEAENLIASTRNTTFSRS